MPALPSLRQLGYLVELAERLNFREAAEAQFVTQSTLSAGIKELETVLGVQLVERDRRTVRLTAIGEDVVARARAGCWLQRATSPNPRAVPQGRSLESCASARFRPSRPICCRKSWCRCAAPIPS